MTKNNGFKKTIRAYMEAHNLTYSEARKILDEESYLQGTGAITLVIGGTWSGRTIQFSKSISHQRHDTAVFLAHAEDLEDIITDHRIEILPVLLREDGSRERIDVVQAKKDLRNLVDQKIYSTIAIEGIDYCVNHRQKNFLDVLPSRADLILSFTFHPAKVHTTDEEFILEVLERLDSMELSHKKLSKRVKVIQHTTDTHDTSKRWADRLNVREYRI
jgi:hypothetical protein